MGVTEIINNIQSLMLPVMIIIGVEFLLIAFYYFFYNKKEPSVRKRNHVKKLMLGALFIGYIVFVCELTIIGRGSSHFLQMNLQPFSGYIDAWKKYSLRDLQNCIFNILMFVPLGVFLPLLFPKFKLFKWLFLVVVSATLSIETYQTLTGAGIFELDDLINNSIGGIIGYQLYRLMASIVQHKKVKIKSLLGNLAIPLIMGLIFVGMMIVYNQQEFGHLAINAYTKSNMSGVDVSTSLDLSTAPTVAPVYKKIMKNDEVETLLQKKLGLSVTSTTENRGDREILLADNAGNPYTLFISSQGNWSLTENLYTPDQTTAAGQDSVNKAKAIMDELALLPQEAEFTVWENGELEWTLPDRANINKDYWLGEVSLGLKPDGDIYSLSSNLRNHQFIKEVNILSPTEVYERIKNGEFPQIKYNALVTDEELTIKKGDQLSIELIELTHMYDTKGFYQPVYNVSGTLNGKSWFTLIQARK
ncbi:MULTISPECIES: VanZ family protein [unclassified Lysinibacillus]|uniref:VanZ family protein n=1 Tax=unclassified Lysinibacillus TaxID=2636778 RepID=UPI0008914FBC|nr:MULTISPECIES: VanZ family protein [unclassified Lysinibacillus]SCY36028.1 Glycopeptide antibiotics resistance protein [Lysinibacillus sp. SG9]SDB18228.1 Glycopeptide antibiotics resistance protein [Lysinibacillus sp. TC-37]SFS65974.1 Glycopeptide antibiotics resistance protein [Lysinibacillus sp. SG55]